MTHYVSDQLVTREDIFTMHELLPVCEIDMTTAPGTEVYGVVGPTTFYRVTWLLASDGRGLYYVGDHSATTEIDRLTGIDDQVERLKRQLEALIAEKQHLITSLLPAPAAVAPAKPKTTRKVYAPAVVGPLTCCGIDGCTTEKTTGRALGMHRQRSHPDWIARQQLLSDDDPRKIGLGAALPAAREVAGDAIPFTQVFQGQPS